MTAIPQAQARSLEDVKDTNEMVETKALEHEETAITELVSNYASLTRSEALRKFWRLFAIGIAVASAGMCVSDHALHPGGRSFSAWH